MDRIEGLDRLIRSDEYRNALGLPHEVTETYEMLAQGEYNLNYAFTHPVTGRLLVLRVNCGSQMHLDDQIEYEYRALKMLAPCGRTPEALYADGSMRHLDHGILVMEYLPGHALDYRTEIMKAAEILADIHSIPVPDDMKPKAPDERTGHSFIGPRDPLKAILEECEQMVSVYMESDLADDSIRGRIRRMLDIGWARIDALHSDMAGSKPEGALDASAERYRCCINTELNSTNFLINDDGMSYLVDWEKPLYGEPAQDLGHFLAPTTTFWKTDVILTEQEMDDFVSRYIEAAGGRFDVTGLRERVRDFTTITCLRGITWCAMAWVEYQEPGRQLTNESTRRKLDQYIDPGFLEYIETILRS